MEKHSDPKTSMKAVRFHGKENLKYEDVPVPVCGPGQVKVKPAWCGMYVVVCLIKTSLGILM